MKMTSRSANYRTEISAEKGLVIDTTFVLFFLALEFGQTLGAFGLDTVFLAMTLLIVGVLPYFLMNEEKPDFQTWLLGRGFIAGLAILLGAMFKQTLGIVLPETFRFLPMTLLIITAMLSCYIQFYSLFKFRLAK